MRRRKAQIRSRVNGNLALRFGAPGLTSFAGLELLRRFLRQIDFSARVRRHLGKHPVHGDFGPVALVRTVLALLWAGGRRLSHVGYLSGDPVALRLCSLAALPGERTLSRWLSRCTAQVRKALQALSAEIVALAVEPLGLARLTVDVDGTVVSTGLCCERAFRGYNPHHRKSKSYYPITAHLAQTGHVLRVQNRSGDVHDGKAALPFLRDLFSQIGESFARALIEIRLDGAFFRKEILSFLEGRAEYAVKVPFYPWLGLKQIIKGQRRWRRVGSGLWAFETELFVEPWNRGLRVVVYRKRVAHESPKNFQLDLFDPADGHYEYSAVTTNKALSCRALWHFMAGRGAHEKALAELKTGYAFASVPGKSYAAAGAWQILCALAHNLAVSFQMAAGAPRRTATRKRSPLFLLQSIRTLRYQILSRAGLVQNQSGRPTLTLSPNLPARAKFENLAQKLAQAA